MFRYKRTIFMERNVPGLKPTASDKLLFSKKSFNCRDISWYYKKMNKRKTTKLFRKILAGGKRTNEKS
jgi:hypothetical protein